MEACAQMVWEQQGKEERIWDIQGLRDSLFMEGWGDSFTPKPALAKVSVKSLG